FKELRWWVGALQHLVDARRRDAEALTNWSRLLPSVEKEPATSDGDWASILKLLQSVPALAEIPQLCDKALVQLAAMQEHASEALAQTTSRLTKALEQSAGASSDILSRLSRLARRCDQFIS